MKKILGLLAVSLFALSFAAGCSKKSEPKEPEPTGETPPEGTGGDAYGGGTTETPPPAE